MGVLVLLPVPALCHSHHHPQHSPTHPHSFQTANPPKTTQDPSQLRGNWLEQVMYLGVLVGLKYGEGLEGGRNRSQDEGR